jgi:predicted PurR-regulated permease PerM
MEDSQVWNLKNNGEQMPHKKPTVGSDGSSEMIVKKAYMFISTTVLIVSVIVNIVFYVLVKPIRAEIINTVNTNYEKIKESQVEIVQLKKDNETLKICVAEIRIELNNINKVLEKIERKL